MAAVPAVGRAPGEAAADVRAAAGEVGPAAAGAVRAADRSRVGLRNLESGALVRQPRWTLVSEPCAVGVITISAMLTWGGRVATQRIASATSSAVSGSIPW